MNTPTRTSSPRSFQSFVLRPVVRWVMYPLVSGAAPVAVRRSRLEKIMRLTRLPLPRGTEIRSDEIGGVPVDWIENSSAPPKRTVLYLHGGAYALASRSVYREYAAHLARSWQARIALIEYRLAPEHPFPAAVDDALAAYRGLLDQGIDPQQLFVAGDSAGGGLTMACTLIARDAGLPLPRALVLYSPWVDLAASAYPDETTERDDMLGVQTLRAAAHDYTGGATPTPVLAEPLHADLHGLPPVMIQATDTEILRHDAQNLTAALEQAGVAVRCDIWTGLWHVWQLFAGKLPEADAALRETRDFLEHPPS